MAIAIFEQVKDGNNIARARPASHKWLVALSVMLGATLEVLDTSIVNVSLPHMQGSFGASRDEVTWVLTRIFELPGAAGG